MKLQQTPLTVRVRLIFNFSLWLLYILLGKKNQISDENNSFLSKIYRRVLIKKSDFWATVLSDSGSQKLMVGLKKLYI